jgi:hypothetical protein
VKFLILVGFVTLSLNVHAASTQICKLKSGSGPLTEFTIEYNVENKSLASKDVVFEFKSNDENVKRKGKTANVEEGNLRTDFDIRTYIEFDGDWAAARVLLLSDDDGVAALVNFLSDGPSLVSFYRCDKFPFQRYANLKPKAKTL